MQVHNLTRSSDDLKLEGYLEKDNIDAGNSESQDEKVTRNSFNFREKTTWNNKGFLTIMLVLRAFLILFHKKMEIWLF